MLEMKEWDGFEGRLWKEEINVRQFIQDNYTPYDGNEDSALCALLLLQFLQCSPKLMVRDILMNL